VKERYSLPIREPDGTLNRNAVHAAAQRITQVKASPQTVRAAARAIVAAYAKLGEAPPPPVVKLAAAGAVGTAAVSAANKTNTESRDLLHESLIEERAAPDNAPPPRLVGNKLVGLIPYNVESRDLGGWRERLASGCLTGTAKDSLVATLNHDVSRLLGRYPTTLTTEDRDDGLAWECELPNGPTGQDVREAVARGDLNGTSWRMIVGRDRWDGDVRVVEEIRELRDVAVVTHAAYPTSVELRSRPDTQPQEDRTMDENEDTEQENKEGREPEQTRGGTLTVEDRSARTDEVEDRSLLGRFRRAGWRPGVGAEVAWEEFLQADEQRSVTWTGSVDNISPLRREGTPPGFDTRYAWPAFPSVSVDPGTTSVQVLAQSARTLPDASEVVRAIDATTPKPEAESTLTVTTLPLKQVAAVETNIPNVFLEQDAVRTVVGQDLRLAVNAGLDKLALDALATAPFHDPGADPLLVAIRRSITILQDAGYNADTVILTPAESEQLDVLQTAGPEELYVFGAGRFAPGQLFGLNVRVSKDAPSAIVVDTSAFGRLYSSPISLRAFEENFGQTNTSLMRLEGHAAFGVERVAAAIRIAAA
jgi:HK97 family phage prohead protease